MTSRRELLAYLADLGYRDLYREGRPGRAGFDAPADDAEPPNVASPKPRGAAEPAESPAPPLPVAEPPAAPAAEVADTPPVAGDSLEERQLRLAAAAEEASRCTRCRLAQGRRSVVFGVGDPDADLMFIGEGPGAEEDRQGLPFVGPAGQLLTRIIGAIGLERDDVYICNVVKCRPPNNRDPQPDEVAACRRFLEEQIRAVRPKVIVALGRVAAQTLLGSDLALGRMRGGWHQVLGVPVRVTYHPAALLRNAALKRPTWEDMQIVRDRLAVER